MTKAPMKHNNSNSIDVVSEYHERTKHHSQRYARSLGYMDWANQPNPFRHYEKALLFPLGHPPITDVPTYDSLFNALQAHATPVNKKSISHFFYESLAISAWKQAGSNRWSLRVNPSSGDLHPTEAYLLTGPIMDLSEIAAIYHYSAYKHALERRLRLDKEWDAISHNLPSNSLLVALASIYWRESWKYGERAFRYCHHDVGHAIGAVTFAAASLGWKTRLIHSLIDDEMTTLLGLRQQESPEVEHPDCLLVIYPANENDLTKDPLIDLPAPLLERINTTGHEGHPNTLSTHHHEWPIIDTVAEACRFVGSFPLDYIQDPLFEKNHNVQVKDRGISARRIIRERRSALDMDGRSHISKETFYRMLMHISPTRGNNITGVLPWRPKISLALFIHRVDGLAPGLYMLVRDNDHEHSLRKTLRPEFRWEKPEDCPESLHLYLMTESDVSNAAKIICCHQGIAADGCFALAMLAEFNVNLEQYGALFYPRLYWETGLIGQILYLEAEAAGIRATGIGCFFDDTMHEILGIRDHTWQSLYHFTVGGPVDDPRLQTLPSYRHLK